MKKLPFQKHTLFLIGILVTLLVLFVYVALRSGPLAPVPVTVAIVENRIVSPSLFGLGTVEARYTYKIGPTYAGRVKRLDVHVGDLVKAGQMLGEMDPVDLDERIRAQEAALKRGAAQLAEAQARMDYAQTQAVRYGKLLKAGSTSEETTAAKKFDLLVAEAGLTGAREEIERLGAERESLVVQRNHLNLRAPVDGLVVKRDAEPGVTVVAGQSVIEVIDPSTLWVNVRIDQIRAQGLSPNLPALITLRSQGGQTQAGRILRVEPLADVVTEEILAKVGFDQLPSPLPPVGELAEVAIQLPELPAGPVIPNAAVQRVDGTLGVWRVVDDELRFAPVSLGASDLNGQVLVREGLDVGDRVVVYSEKALSAHSRFKIVDRLPGVAP